MPAARCDDCSAQVTWYCHTGRKLSELKCPCGGGLTNAPHTWCHRPACQRHGYHRKDPKTKKKTCNLCLDGEKKTYPLYRVSTTEPAVGETKNKSVTKPEWTTVKTHSGPEYHHVGKEWIVRRRRKGSRDFIGIYTGSDRSDQPRIPCANSLRESQANVLNWLLKNQYDPSPRARAVRAQRDGNEVLAIDCIFDYIDARFDELDDRLDRLRSALQRPFL